MDFHLTAEHKEIQSICRQLATDFATRAAQHDRENSLPLENYTALKQAGLYNLTVPEEFGGKVRDCLVGQLPVRNWPKAVRRLP